MFIEELRTLEGYEAKLYVDPEAKPQFHKAHSVRDMVEKELDQLVNEEIIEPVQFAD